MISLIDKVMFKN